MKPLDAIRERRRRELEADRATSNLAWTSQSMLVPVQSLTRELCAASAGLEPEFTMAALRLAFKRCALKVHPDKARATT
jgi:hypothetical protein